MSPTPITRKQFVRWIVFFTIGMALWAWPSDSGLIIGGGVVGCSNLILLSPAERSRSLRAREAIWMFSFLILFFVFVVVVDRCLPERYGASFAGILRHPASIGAIWLANVWLTYRRHFRARVQETRAT